VGEREGEALVISGGVFRVRDATLLLGFRLSTQPTYFYFEVKDQERSELPT
jgi:hypothetical protein